MCGAEWTSNWDHDNIIIAGHTDRCHCLVHGKLPSLLVVHTQEWNYLTTASSAKRMTRLRRPAWTRRTMPPFSS